jgi:hypothetical protein
MDFFKMKQKIEKNKGKFKGQEFIIKSRKSQTEPLGSFTVNVIIGVIVLFMLIAAIYVLYRFFSSEGTELNIAEKYVKLIKKQMEIAKESPGEEFSIDVTGPGNEWWWIVAFPFANTVERPVKCYSERKSSCICICERPSNLRVAWTYITFGGGTITSMVDGCNSAGKCQIIEEPVKTSFNNFESPIPIEKPPIQINIVYDGPLKGYMISFVK